MQPTGLAAFDARKEDRSGIYSHEQGDVELPEPHLGLLHQNRAAWEFYERQPATYRKAVNWWVASARSSRISWRGPDVQMRRASARLY